MENTGEQKKGIDKYSYKDKNKFSCRALYQISKSFSGVYQIPSH